jgi:hypothetical protein
MSGVVLRCPNCGTTKAAPGECEACHEAQARYYCTNHAPGRWLDAPSCPECGARFGEPTRAPVRSAPAAPTGAPVRPSPAAAPRRTPALDPSPAPWPTPAPAARPATGDSWGGRSGRRPPIDDDESESVGRYERGERVVRGPSWDDLLRAAARARRSRTAPVVDREATPPFAARRPGGCLWRFVQIMVLLFLALTGGVSVLGGSLLRLFLPYCPMPGARCAFQLPAPNAVAPLKTRILT